MDPNSPDLMAAMDEWTLPIEEASDAFAALEQGGAMKILVDCRGR
jgi:hypothetical protein